MSDITSFSLDDAALRLRSDTNIDPMLGVQYSSVRAIVRDVVRLYRAHFWTLVAIYLLPVAPFTIIGAILPGETHAAVIWSSTILGFFAGTFAFAAVAVAMSDVCSGNRPGVRRSYRRIFGRRLGVVIVNTILFYLAVLPAYVPFLLTIYIPCLSIPAFILAALLSVRYMFVPIISAIEPRPGVARTFKRSAWLGSDYLLRAVGTFMCIGGAGAAIGGVVYLAFAALGKDVAWIAVNIVGAALILPPLYVAVVLQYYDLRSRKEGFRLVELPEDIV